MFCSYVEADVEPSTVLSRAGRSEVEQPTRWVAGVHC